MTTAIEWTDETWNVVTGCDRVSPGCDHCYIERTIPFRIEGRRFDENGRMGIRLHPDRLDKPLHWRKPRLVFVNSLSDLFHRDVPSDLICRVWEVMGQTPQHSYQILTKRPHRMRELLSLNVPDPLPNVWLGVSVEDQRYADLRIPRLLDTPAAVRFLSCEPLLGPLPSLDLTGIDWVIVGGESGPGARPMHPDWVRNIRDRCVAASTPFFFKQWGAWGEWSPGWPDHVATPQEWARCGAAVAYNGEFCPGMVGDNPDHRRWGFGLPDGSRLHAMYRVGKKAAGRELDGRTWDEMPAVAR